MNAIKIFTVEEVNRLLPKVRVKLEHLRILRDNILRQEAHMDAVELVAETGKGSPLLESVLQDYHRAVSSFYDELDQLAQDGFQLKDLEAGLVDFYSMIDGRLVFLCWKSGESKVTHWHELDRGFDYRQALDPEFLENDTEGDGKEQS